MKREFPMSLNDTTFHVIAQTPTPHPQNKTFQCSLLPIVLLLRDTFSKPVFSISKIHHKFDHSLPSTLFLAQCNSFLPCFSTFILASKIYSLKANYMILFKSCSNYIATFLKTPAVYRTELPVL